MRVSILCTSLFLWQIFAGAADNTPASFPVVDSATQKVRDESRLEILQAEKAEEIGRLNKAKSDLAAAQNAKRPASEIGKLGESLHRHEANIASLNQEISRAGQQKPSTRPVRLASVKQPAPALAPAKTADEVETNSTLAPFWDVYRRQANNQIEGKTKPQTRLTAY